MDDTELLQILRSKLADETDPYAPLALSDLRLEEEPAADETCWRPDLRFALRWGGKVIEGTGALKGDISPRLAREIAREMQDSLSDSAPTLVVPYLSAGIARELQRAKVSGIDLNGNYLILTPELVAVRLDQPNQYPESRDIQKIYTYNSSIVGRFLLVEKRTFEQVNEIYEGIEARGGGISLSTVSKVLKGLQDDVIIHKERGEIRLLQPERLLDQLRDGYRAPRVKATLKVKLPEGEGTLDKAVGPEGWVWSGESSAEAYATTTPMQVREALTTKSLGPANPLREYEDSRFYNCIVKQTDDNYPLFDRRERWASPVEAYLALAQLGKREREIATSIRENVLLKDFDDV